VLTTRAKNTEFAEMDEDEAVEVLSEQIEDIFGSFEAFLEREEIQAAIDADPLEVFDIDIDADTYADKRARPDALHGVSQRVDTGYGKIYVTINEDPETGEPFELFANIGHSGGFTNSFTEALAKVISTALRSGVDPMEIVDELQGTRSPKVAWDKGEQIQSIPDAIGTAMRRYLEDEVDKPYPKQQTLEETVDETTEEPASEDAQTARDPNAEVVTDTGSGAPEPDGGSKAAAATNEDATQDLISAGESPECPECGAMTLHYSEGCKTCESCGWSEC
jgi:ribonucleoside-diphosphate reductase alpha chain